MTEATTEASTGEPVSFQTEPSRYRHWRLASTARSPRWSWTSTSRAGLRPGYELKLNSYDLGVDIELYDAVQRLRFEHPEVRRGRTDQRQGQDLQCRGEHPDAGRSAHPWKVNFCKFTNETRNGIEDATANSGQTYLAALNGTASGGGYELALACEHILLVDDRSSAVSLPELPLLGVLPGTGGLTRVIDKRHVRRDRADYFATRSEGVGGTKAVEWRLVDEVVPRRAWDETVRRGPRSWPRAPPARRRRRDRADPAGQGARPGPDQLPARDGRSRPRARAPWRSPWTVRRGAAGGRRRDLARGRRLLDAGGDPRAGRPDPRPADQRARPRHLGAAHRRRREAGAGLRRAAGPRRRGRRLAGQRDPALPQAHAQAAGRDQPQPDRADRAGQLLRRLSCSSWPWPRTGRTCWTATFETTATTPAPEIVLGELNCGPLPMGNGLTRLAVPVPRRRGRP